ncbi:SAR2788 family putative toxin [Peribacillus sp. RS7]|jgi:hypothetical protein|uniref:SAR2788 family putative toxin n=1 Tax=Peribacillus sp. RS7 TaxID=3242679 RepID=UPI0035C20C8F
MKKNLIFLLLFTLFISILPNKMSANSKSIVSEEQIIELQENIETELLDENIELEDFDISSEELLLEASVENAVGETGYIKVEVEPGAEFIKLYTEEINELGELEKKEYQVPLNELEYSTFDNEIVDVTIIDTNSGEEFNYNSEEGNASLAFLIPLGIAMSPAVLTALFHTGAMIIVGGSAFVIATQAKKDKKYIHFQATVKSGGVYIGKGLSKSAAISRMKSKKDTWSVSSNQAQGVAQGANTLGKPFAEVDKKDNKPRKGYYWHWHPYKKTPNAHAFYGGPVK